MTKRILLALVIICTGALCFAGGSQEDRLREINVSYVKSPFNLPSIVMKEKGMLTEAFEKQGIQLNYYEITSGSKQAQAMAAGSLDIGGVMNTTSVLLAKSAGNDVRIVSGFSRPVHMFSIVVKDPAIKSVVDLKGKTVAGPKGTVLHQLLAAALEKKGMSVDDVEFLQMTLPQASTAMIAGQIDAALLAGSLVINAEKNGAHIVTTAEGLVTPKLVIAARGDFVDSHPEAIEAYVTTHREALDWMEKNIEEALQIGAVEQGISVDEARRLYEWTEFTDSLEGEDLVTLQDDIEFMLKNGMLTEALQPEACIAATAMP